MVPDIPHTENEYKIYEECQDFRHLHYCRGRNGVGITVLLRDILFAPPLVYYALELSCQVLSVALLLLLTYFYARKDWQSYTKRNLWAICIIDMLIATLYNLDIYLEPTSEYTNYMLTEIWIRPTITYGLVACFITEAKAESK